MLRQKYALTLARFACGGVGRYGPLKDEHYGVVACVACGGVGLTRGTFIEFGKLLFQPRSPSGRYLVHVTYHWNRRDKQCDMKDARVNHCWAVL